MARTFALIFAKPNLTLAEQYPSDDRLWRETLSHGNSDPPVSWYFTQAPLLECSDGSCYSASMFSIIVSLYSFGLIW